MQRVTGKSVELAYVDQGYTWQNAADAAEQHGIRLEVVTPLGPRLRTTPRDARRTPLHRLRHAYERQTATPLHANFITVSSDLIPRHMSCSEGGMVAYEGGLAAHQEFHAVQRRTLLSPCRWRIQNAAVLGATLCCNPGCETTSRL